MARIFLAGASGAVGRRLSLLLAAGGYEVYGTTRSAAKAGDLQAIGVVPVIVDVFDAAKLDEAVAAARPDVVIHQLTDLPPGLDPVRMAEARIANARLRETGTRNLVAAAVNAGARRIVAQSVAFSYAPGPEPFREEWPLNTGAEGDAGVSARGVASLEDQVLGSPLESVVLRYGKLYGPGTGFDAPSPGGPLHVDAAADAARRAIEHGSGIYNVAEDDGSVSAARVRSDLGWSPDFRIG